ncbi:MAG: hypothetical protein OZ921_14600 [Sorangiineae bacterium]|nr:hypothetical protein [Polyangiaceae bacterium]MEB2323738.1 hypothetical protein [Sorangiineae bacterium]
MRLLPAFVAALMAAACHSPGAYGHARVYTPLDEEAAAAENARAYDPALAARMPDEWKRAPVSVFGVVKARLDGASGAASLSLGVRKLEARNLCDTEDEDTCRVTVSEHDFASLHAEVRLREEDELGSASVGPGSLVRVIGVIADDVDPNDGAPVIRARYYRHWPRGHYLTTAAPGRFRR